MKRPFENNRVFGPFIQFNSTQGKPYDVAFKKSGLDRTLCEEITTFAQLKLEDAIDKHRRERNETAFGMVVQQNQVYFTKTVSGVTNTIPMEIIEDIDSKLDRIESNVGTGDRCIVHTHDRSATPSKSDVKTFLSSLSPDSHILEDKKALQFDCYSVIGVTDDNTAEIYSWEITGKPPETEFYGMIEELTAEGYRTKDRREFEEDALDIFSDYIKTCRTEFEIRS